MRKILILEHILETQRRDLIEGCVLRERRQIAVLFSLQVRLRDIAFARERILAAYGISRLRFRARRYKRWRIRNTLLNLLHCHLPNLVLMKKLTRLDLKHLVKKEHTDNFIFDTFHLNLPRPHSRHENCRAFEPASAEIGEGLIGLVERIGCGMGDDADLRSQTQKIDSILPFEIGDRHELPLFP